MKIKALVKDKTVDYGHKPKIGYFDIETSPLLVWTWTYYEGDALKVEQDVKIITFAWQWEDEKKATVYSLPDFPGYKADPFNIDDSKITMKLWEYLDEADVVIAHNGNKFDIKRSNAEFLIHDIPPPSSYIPIDTLLMARRYFGFTSNKLGEIMRQLGLKGKLSTGGKELWFKCMEGDEKAWATMKKYCKNDTELLPPLYRRMRGWHKNHPNLSFFDRESNSCPKCLSKNIQRRGKLLVRNGIRMRYSCNNCTGWFSGEILKDGIDKIKSY